MEDLDRLRARIFAHLDSELPDSLKRKLSASDVKTLIAAFSNFHIDNSQNVLQSSTSSPQLERGPSRFEPVEELTFVKDLSKL